MGIPPLGIRGPDEFPEEAQGGLRTLYSSSITSKVPIPPVIELRPCSAKGVAPSFSAWSAHA